MGARKIKPMPEPVEGPEPGSQGHERFPIVGIGASAGGLGAFESFFAGLEEVGLSGMAFVLVQHLSPDHESLLPELIRRSTRLRVLEAMDGMAVEVDTVYVTPPNKDLALLEGRLHLLVPVAPRGRRLPIDSFFRSLALERDELAFGIILSGTGADGSHGIREIKAGGGIVLAQAPATADFDGMPRNAMATGLVDFVLHPGDMAGQLATYISSHVGPAFHKEDQPQRHSVSELQKVFVLLRTQTSHDFSLYKPSTITRRLERRMAVRQMDGLEAYVKLLQKDPAEVEALFRDLLIGVTRFFRDPEAFSALETQALPLLMAERDGDSVVRAWVPACSTGEEAYSLAILIQERMNEDGQSLRVQIFATDIDANAIAQARTGIYPASVAADISPERLARFFTPESESGGFRVHKTIRDMVIFSEQDLIKDPPFSRLDLISCRNLLIYLGGELQKTVLPILHYSLNPGGFLFLGNSETVGEFDGLFLPVDRKAKLYMRRIDVPGIFPFAPARFSTYSKVRWTQAPLQRVHQPFHAKPPLKSLVERALLEEFAPVAALVNARGEVLYLHGRTGLYLEPAPGEAGVSSILKMARPGLRQALSSALREAVAMRVPVRSPPLAVIDEKETVYLSLTVKPLQSGEGSGLEPDLFLVALMSVEPPLPSDLAAVVDLGLVQDLADQDPRILGLRRELRATEDYLHSANEELASSNEELQSSNEELQSINEELQSANEELETSKEELQSVNEELSTVNAELQAKVLDLSRANNDMNNLLAGTGIGTVFVDHQLRILRFTPAVTTIINLIPGDRGRPVGHIVSNLRGYSRLVEDLQEVLDTLVPKDLEVQTTQGGWYSMRILPYRTLENVIEGAVITFVDINERKLVQEALRESESKLRLLSGTEVLKIEK